MAGCAVVLGGLIVAALAAADEPPATAPTADVQGCTECRQPSGTDAGAPSMDMLLYLAEFGDAEDHHVDPAEVAAELERAKTNDTAAPHDDRPNDDAHAPAPVDR